MVFRKRRKIIPAKTPGELDAMQAAGEVVGKALQAVKACLLYTSDAADE